MRIIPGFIKLNEFRSDADTFPFRPTNSGDLAGLGLKPIPTPSRPWVRVRLDAIDTPELHYEGLSQSTEWGRAATEFMYLELGGGGVSWSLAGNNPMNSEEIPVQLGIVGVDRFKRVIGFVWSAAANPTPTTSVNFYLATAGLAYPAIFSTTPNDHAAAIRHAVDDARANDAGFWPVDQTEAFDFAAAATDQALIMVLPKIWRRVGYYAAGHPNLSDWQRFMKSKRDLIQPTTGLTLDLRKAVHLDGDTLTVDPNIMMGTWLPRGLFTTSQVFAWMTHG